MSVKRSGSRTSTLAIVCGGTGGHFFPGLSIAEEFRRRQGRAVLIIAGHNQQKYYDIACRKQLEAIKAGAVKSPSGTSKIPFFIIKFIFAVLISIFTILKNRVTVVLTMGSFLSAPFGVAAILTGRPLVLHEGNAILGRTNRFLSRWAKILFISMPLGKVERTRSVQKIVGFPLRDSFIKTSHKLANSERRKIICHQEKMTPDLPILLVFGGSQGARKINESIKEAVELLPGDRNSFQIIHLTGQDDGTIYSQLYHSKGINAVVKKFETDMDKLILIADLVVCRSGASTVFELACLRKPAVFIPLSTALDDHQRHNAQLVVQRGGGFMLEESESLGENLLRYMETLTKNPNKLKRMGENLKGFANPHATQEIVDQLCEFLPELR